MAATKRKTNTKNTTEPKATVKPISKKANTSTVTKAELAKVTNEVAALTEIIANLKEEMSTYKTQLTQFQANSNKRVENVLRDLSNTQNLGRLNKILDRNGF